MNTKNAKSHTADLKAVVIAGTGKGGASHGTHHTFDQIPRVELTALSDPDEQGRAKLAKECGVANTYQDYREMLEREKPDIVVISRHWYDDGRVEEILAALDCGAKGIYAEKTIAAWPYQARKIQKAAAEKRVPVIMAHRSREHPAMQRINELARKGTWGPLTRVRAMDKGDHRAGVHEAMIHTPHVFDAMLYVVGEEPVSCWGSVMLNGRPVRREDGKGVEYLGAGPMAGDRIAAQYQFKNGVVGTFESMPVGDGSYGSDRLGIDFYFQEAIVTARNQPKGQFAVFPRGDVFPAEPGVAWETMEFDGWAPEGVPTMTWSNHVHGQELVELMDGGEVRPEMSTIDVCVTAVEMLVGSYQSHFEGRRIALPLSDLANPWA